MLASVERMVEFLVDGVPIAIDFDPAEKWQLEAKLTGYDDFVQPISFDDCQSEKTYTIELTGVSGKLDAFLVAIDRAAIL